MMRIQLNDIALGGFLASLFFSINQLIGVF